MATAGKVGGSALTSASSYISADSSNFMGENLTASTTATSPVSSSISRLQTRSLDIGHSLVEATGTAISTAGGTSQLTPSLGVSIAAGVVALAALGSQVTTTVTARQGLAVSKAARDASRTSATTAQVFRYNVVEDASTALVKARKTNAKPEPTFDPRQVILNKDMFPSLEGVS